MEFSTIKQAVQRQFLKMKDQPLFRVNLDKDKLWDLYLSSFPEGTNPMYRERTEHDCSCCRSFIRAVGDMVCIDKGKLVSLWDVEVGGFYQVVADAMAAYVKSCAVDNVFLHTEPQAGVDKNYEQDGDKVVTWEHFHIQIPKPLICKGVDIGSKLSDYRATHDVMARGLQEITLGDIETVQDLIRQNSLYRGSEHSGALDAFKKLKLDYEGAQNKDLFVWSQVTVVSPAVSRIRNTVIGTLLTDLAEGKELEDAVKAYEFKVAPANYKRPTALVTPAMIAKAKETLSELGLLSALDRRYAVLEDINVTNVLFADRSAKKRMSGDVFDDLIAAAPKKSAKALNKVEEITIDQLIENVLPTAESLELFLSNKHTGNLVSLIAPADLTASGLFKWNNPFSWSYNGDVADSMKERVKAAGGKVDGVLRFSIQWAGDNGDNSDLDAHCKAPDGHIYFGNRVLCLSSGNLDVDITSPSGKIAVENITWPALSRMPDGKYEFYVHQFSARNSQGFTAEIEFAGQVHEYSYPRAVSGHVPVAEVTKTGSTFTIEHKLPSQVTSRKVWGLDTENFQKVSVVMLSPNHWDGAGVGNKHFFFMLEGCANEGRARGFYNEFLSAELDKHRKVLEVVGSKMSTDENPNQLSGVGFSSTQRNEVIVKVGGSFNRTLKITF